MSIVWTPADISTIAWYDASDASTITFVGSDVNVIDDKSGNNYHLTAVDGSKRPEYLIAGINGLNVLHYSGTLDEMMVNVSSIDCSEVFIIGVGMAKTPGDYPNMGHVNNTAETDKMTIRGQSNPTTGRISSIFILDGVSSPLVSSYETELAEEIAFMSATWYDGTDANANANGGSITKVIDVADGATFTINHISLGRDSNAPMNYQGEFIVLSTADPVTRQKCEGYLAWKWGLEATLPSNHPYKTYMPLTEFLPYDVKSNLHIDGNLTFTGSISGTWYGDGSFLTGISGAPVEGIHTSSVSVSGYGWVIDEDDFASESTSKIPTQQSVKAYLDSIFNPSGPSNGFTSGGIGGANVIDKYLFSGNSTASDHGDLSINRWYTNAGASSSTQGFTSCGYNGSFLSSIDKFDFSSNTTASSHGNNDVTKYDCAGTNSSTDGFIVAGYLSANTSTISKFAFSSNTTASSHGNLNNTLRYANTTKSSTQGFTCGGYTTVFINVIDKFDFSSNTTASDHGDLQAIKGQGAVHFSTTQGFHAGNGGPTDMIDRFNFSSNTTASDHGNLSIARALSANSSSSTQGFTNGGYTGGHSNVIDFYNFSANTTATDHGDLSVARSEGAGHQGG